MLSFDIMKHNPALFLTFTGLALSEFEMLSVSFKKALKDYIVKEYVEKEGRKRKYGGGRKPKLRSDEGKLLFILIYFKLYPLQAVIGFLFGMSQSQACEQIHKLSGILKTASESLDLMPERIPENLKAALSECDEDEVIIDGTERKKRRPQDPDKQKKYNSGKKKTHTVKNNVIVTAEG